MRCLLWLACCAVAGQGVEVYVSPTGSDAAAGTAAQPFQTLTRARDALRQAGPAGSTVWLQAGTYALAEPFTLAAEDSGRPGAPVVYRAAPDADVWLTGALPVPRPALAKVTEPALLARIDPSARGQVRQFKLTAEHLAALVPAWPDTWWSYGRDVNALNELFSGAERLPMARWPNDDYTTFGEIVEPAEQDGQTPTFKYLGDRPARWQPAVADGLWLYGYWRRGYRSEFVKVKSLDPATQTIELAARNSLGPVETGGASRYCAMHVLEELDVPGEWYLDRTRGLLLVWPPDGDQPLTLSYNPTAVIHADGVSNVEFRGLGIEGSAGCGILTAGGADVRIVGCEVRNVGTHGIDATGDRQAIVGCDIHDTGDKAIVLRSGDRYTLTRGESLIDNCWLHHTNRVVRAGSQTVALDGVGNRMSHNVIHDTGYIAIRFAGNDHLLEYNHLFRTNVESAEGGVFYTGRDWTSRGTVVRYNFMHHVQDSVEGAGSSTRFMHLDDSAPEIDIYGNVCYRMGGGVSICGGAANTVHDNLFVECAWGVDIGPRGADMFESDGHGGYKMVGQTGWSTLARYLERYKWNQPPYSTHYPKLIEIFSKDPIAAPWFNVVERNVMVDCGAGIKESGMVPGWSTVDRNWVGDEPGFVEPDHTKLDFRLKPDAAPIQSVGYQPPPLEQIGLYESPDRRSWPVKLDLPPADWRPRWMHLRDAAKRSPHGLPIFKVAERTAPIVIDGVIDPMEWTPGDATGHAPELHDTAELAWSAAGGKASRPSQAMIQTDAANLYLNFHNEIGTAAGLSGGHVWGKDDAVELAVAEVKDGEIGPILLYRGYADGIHEVSGEAGVIGDRLLQQATDLRYAAKLVAPGLWTAEFAIPFKSLGIDPTERNPRLVFNLSVRKVAGDEWVTWKSMPGRTWELQQSGFLWLAQFGDMAADGTGQPSQARIDLDSRQHPVTMTAGEGCKVQDWAQPVGCYLSATWDGLPTDRWQEISFSFTPQADGQVILKLMGAGVRVPGSDEFLTVWTYTDNVRVEGAELVNGDFEVGEKQGLPEGWRKDVGLGLLIHDAKLAASGEYCVKTAHNQRFAQVLKVTAGRMVTLRMMVRGVGG